MNDYRKKLKFRNIFLSIGVLSLLTVQILAYINIIRPIHTENTWWGGIWSSFIAGMAMGLMCLLIIGFVVNLFAMRNDTALKKHFVKENDERTNQISVKGRSAGASSALWIMLIAGIISGYFSIPVFVTCIACVFILSLSMLAGKLYYNKKI